MKYCSTCGNPLPDDAAFCGNCGTPVPRPQDPAGPTSFCRVCGRKIPASAATCPFCGVPTLSAPGQPPQFTGQQKAPAAHRRNTGLIIAIVAVAVVVLGVLAVGGLLAARLFTSPVTKFFSYNADLLSDRVMPLLDTVSDSLGQDEFSSDMTITGSVDNAAISSYLDNSAITLKTDLDDDGLLINGEVELLGSSVLNATVTYKDGMLGLYLPELDQNYYVADLSQLFFNITGQWIDLSELGLPDISTDEIMEVLKPYGEALIELVNKDSITKEKNVSLSLGALPFSGKCTVYTFSPRAEEYRAMLLKLADLLENDTNLQELIQKIQQSTFSELYMGADLQYEVSQALTQAANDLRTNADSYASYLEQSHAAWTVAVEGGQVRQVKLSAYDSYYGSDSGIVYEAVGDGKSELNEVIYFLEDGSNETILTNRQTMSGKETSGTLNIYFDYSDYASINYDMTKDKTSRLGIPYGTFSLWTTEGSPTFSLTVQDGAAGGTDHILSISNAAPMFDYAFSSLNVTLNTTDKTSAKAPDIAPVDVTNYSDDQIEEIAERIASRLESDLISNLGPLLYDW